MPRVWLSIGSNQDRVHNVRAAVARLRAAFGEVVVSPVYESEAGTRRVGCADPTSSRPGPSTSTC